MRQDIIESTLVILILLSCCLKANVAILKQFLEDIKHLLSHLLLRDLRYQVILYRIYQNPPCLSITLLPLSLLCFLFWFWYFLINKLQEIILLQDNKYLRLPRIEVGIPIKSIVNFNSIHLDYRLETETWSRNPIKIGSKFETLQMRNPIPRKSVPSLEDFQNTILQSILWTKELKTENPSFLVSIENKSKKWKFSDLKCASTDTYAFLGRVG